MKYVMPAEWERHTGVWLAWPYDISTFPELEKVEEIYVRIISLLSKEEKVKLLLRDSEMESRVARVFKERKRTLVTPFGMAQSPGNLCGNAIETYVFDYADVWLRDYGPVFVVNREERKRAMVDWDFNAWGRKYEELIPDGRVPSFINEKTGMPLFKPGIILEGGSIDVNGKGTLLTTQQCLLNSNRNPGLNKEDIERSLKENLGVNNIVWLKRGIAGDDTDGHIDNVARFVGPDTVLYASEEDEDDENYSALKENYESLLKEEDRFNLVKIPMPSAIRDSEGRRLPASYTNFYIGNGTVLVPVFGDKNDDIALDILRSIFTDRKVVGIDSSDLIYGGGAIHCITQQEISF